MSEAYAFGAGCPTGAVKIIQRGPSKSSWGKDRYYVYPLERVEQVQALGDGRMYRLIWRKEPIRAPSGMQFYDYQPYEDNDVAVEVTQELIDHIKASYNYMLQWYTTTTLKPEKVPQGFMPYTEFKTQRLA